MGPMIRACLFDLGNTLVPDVSLFQTAVAEYAAALHQRGFVPSADEFVRTVTRANRARNAPFLSHTYGEEIFFADALAELGLSGLTPRQALTGYREVLMRRMEVDPEVAAGLDFLRERGTKVGLLSNESVARVDAFLDKTGIGFDIVIVSQAVGIEKPDRRIFQEALDRLGLPAADVAMFGDNVVADGACRDLGITFVLVTGYRRSDWAWEEGSPREPDHVLEKITIAALRDFLERR